MKDKVNNIYNILRLLPTSICEALHKKAHFGIERTRKAHISLRNCADRSEFSGYNLSTLVGVYNKAKNDQRTDFECSVKAPVLRGFFYTPAHL